MKVKENNIIILWALGSNCNLQCEYCYFGIPENKALRSEAPDINTQQALDFIKDVSKTNIKRICIAGAEPLFNRDIFKIFKALKEARIPSILSTNGTFITRKVAEQLIENNLIAVFISLDSHKAEYHNKWRGEFHTTIQGIKNLVAQKQKTKSKIKIGIYAVMTKENIGDLIETMDFVINLGVDYFVFQPVWLPKNNPLYKQLSLTERQSVALNCLIFEAKKRRNKITIPNDKYLALLKKNFAKQNIHYIKNCFCGKDFFFIDPKGNIYNCPSTFKINTTSHLLNIKQDKFSDLVSRIGTEKQKSTECKFFSLDCIPMWELYYSNLFNN